MRALQLKSFQSDPELVDLPEPEPGPGQVVVKIGGAGACHSDLHVMREFAEGMAPWGPPFVIGHEAAGWVHRLGDQVRGLEPGEPVAVYGLLGCGHCQPCAAGAENLCIHGMEGPPGIGFGVDGAMADYLLVADPRRLVPIGDLDPVDVAPLDRRRADAVPRRQARGAETDSWLPRRGDRRRRSGAPRRPDPHRADPGQGDRGGHAGVGARSGRGGGRGQHGARRRRRRARRSSTRRTAPRPMSSWTSSGRLRRSRSARRSSGPART